MPATAGRVRMPASNRVHSSAALQTHGIWQSAIGYDPYAPTAKDKDPQSDPNPNSACASAAAAADNAYTSFQGLLALACITGSNADETRGSCKKCCRVGHLTFQCRNFLSIKDGEEEENDGSALKAATAVFNKIKRGGKEDEESKSGDGEEESESSDSDVNPEIEKIIAARMGKMKESGRRRSKSRSTKKRSKRSEDSDEDREKRKEKRKRMHRDSDEEEGVRIGGGRVRRRRGDEGVTIGGEMKTLKKKMKTVINIDMSHRKWKEDTESSGCDEKKPSVRRKKRSEKRSRKHRHNEKK